jgi:hypothetical protein
LICNGHYRADARAGEISAWRFDIACIANEQYPRRQDALRPRPPMRGTIIWRL